jgi:chromate transporter
MSIYLRLFLTFLQIGAFSFGGGYGMIALIKEKCLEYAWLTEEELMNFIAVAESTPGPIAVNMATFVGSSQGGVNGALIATLGVVLPSFILILLISILIKNFINYKGVQAAIKGIKPVIVGLIIATGITMLLSVVIGFTNVNSAISFDYKALIILSIIVIASLTFKKIKKKAISPIILILLSAVLGVGFYSL